METARRRRLYELAVAYDCFIVEDNPYFELYYDAPEPLPLVKSLDRTGRVIFCGSYSKIVSPGLRVGFCVLDKRLTQKFTVAKQVMDVHSANLPQLLVYEYVKNYDLEAHIRLCRDVYRAQRDLMVSELEKNLAGTEARGVQFTRPGGGLFIWVDLPPEKSGYVLFERLVTKNLATVPGSTFDPAARRDKPGIRLNFSMPAPEDIVKGCKVFGDTVKEFIE
jgi:2-aminoadipate transaminase